MNKPNERSDEVKGSLKVNRREFPGYCASLFFGGLFLLSEGKGFTQPIGRR